MEQNNAPMLNHERRQNQSISHSNFSRHRSELKLRSSKAVVVVTNFANKDASSIWLKLKPFTFISAILQLCDENSASELTLRANDRPRLATTTATTTLELIARHDRWTRSLLQKVDAKELRARGSQSL